MPTEWHSYLTGSPGPLPAYRAPHAAPDKQLRFEPVLSTPAMRGQGPVPVPQAVPSQGSSPWGLQIPGLEALPLVHCALI